MEMEGGQTLFVGVLIMKAEKEIYGGRVVFVLTSMPVLPPPSTPPHPAPSFLPPFLPPTAFGEPKVVCVRTAETAEDVEEVILALRNTTGRKVKPLRKPVISRLPSVQVGREGWGGREGRREGGRERRKMVEGFETMSLLLTPCTSLDLSHTNKNKPKNRAHGIRACRYTRKKSRWSMGLKHEKESSQQRSSKWEDDRRA